MEVLQRTANRGSVSTASYEIDNSLKMEADNSESISRTPSSAGNRKTWTLSFWFKRTELGAAVRLFEAWDGSTGTSALFTDADLFILDLTAGSNYFTSSGAFRDTAAWYHFVIRVDTTQGTASERARVYVNGSELAGAWNSNIGQNTDLTWNQDVVHYFGVFHNTGNFANGYYAEVINVDGTSLAPTAFGEVDSDSGIWKPIDASPTYGTNGFKLEFKTSGGLGADTSGNGHTWTLNNIAAADQATDTPTNNFATGNPLVYFSNPTMATFNAITEGATQFKKGANGWETMTSSIAVTSGKWYIEIQNISVPDSAMMGITPADSVLIFQGGRISYHMGASSGDGGVAQYGQNGTLYKEGVGITYSPSPTWVGGTTVQGIALDMDNGKVYFAKENTWMNNGDPTTGSTGTGAVDIPDYTTKPYVFGYSLYANNHNGRMNFGGYTSGSISSAASDANGYGTFEYAPPSGYYSLCTKNLAEFGG